MAKHLSTDEPAFCFHCNASIFFSETRSSQWHHWVHRQQTIWICVHLVLCSPSLDVSMNRNTEPPALKCILLRLINWWMYQENIIMWFFFPAVFFLDRHGYFLYVSCSAPQESNSDVFTIVLKPAAFSLLLQLNSFLCKSPVRNQRNSSWEYSADYITLFNKIIKG